MFIFGGLQALIVTERDALYPRKNLPLGDLWAFDLIAHHWHQVFATGVHPSARSDMGQHSPITFHALLHLSLPL
jgi:hypothetical protein